MAFPIGREVLGLKFDASGGLGFKVYAQGRNGRGELEGNAGVFKFFLFSTSSQIDS